MGKHGELIDLRLKLDDEITYGTKKKAMQLARQGVLESKKKCFAAELQYFLGQQDILNNKFVSAIEHFDKAIEYNCYDGAAYNDRALCMIELGILDESLAYFDKGIEVESDYATIYHNKGWLLNNIGRHKEAVDCFKKALKLDSNRAVTYDNLADALFNLDDFRGALKAYKKVLELLKPNCCKAIRKEIKNKITDLEARLGLCN